jgi:hypothetical protein
MKMNAQNHLADIEMLALLIGKIGNAQQEMKWSQYNIGKSAMCLVLFISYP